MKHRLIKLEHDLLLQHVLPLLIAQVHALAPNLLVLHEVSVYDLQMIHKVLLQAKDRFEKQEEVALDLHCHHCRQVVVYQVLEVVSQIFHVAEFFLLLPLLKHSIVTHVIKLVLLQPLHTVGDGELLGRVHAQSHIAVAVVRNNLQGQVLLRDVEAQEPEAQGRVEADIFERLAVL